MFDRASKKLGMEQAVFQTGAFSDDKRVAGKTGDISSLALKVNDMKP